MALCDRLKKHLCCTSAGSGGRCCSLPNLKLLLQESNAGSYCPGPAAQQSKYAFTQHKCKAVYEATIGKMYVEVHVHGDVQIPCQVPGKYLRSSGTKLPCAVACACPETSMHESVSALAALSYGHVI
jgi:hypothetical protein